MKRPIQLVMLICIVIIALSIVRVTLENRISTAGIELVKLQAQVDKYKKSNAILKERYLSDSSLTNLASVAKEKGFVPAANQIYLSTPLPLALQSSEAR